MTTTAQPELAKTQAARDALDLRMIPLDEIAADPDQPRRRFDEASLDELAASLKVGQTNPIRVRPRGAADHAFPAEVKWVLMHGERRLRAARKAEIPRLRAEVAWDVGAQEWSKILLDQIADNLHGVDLGAVEESAAIRRYAKLSKLGTRAIAEKLGKNQMYVSLALGMEKMPADLLKKIERNELGVVEDGVEAHPLTWKHLRALLRLKDHPVELSRVYDNAIQDRSTSRELEQSVDWALQAIERDRKAAERAVVKEVAKGATGDTADQPAPLSTLDQKEKDDRLDKARMTRARKDVIRGMLPEIVSQVYEIAVKIVLPAGLAKRIAFTVRCHDATTRYADDLAQLIVPELRGQWTEGVARFGSAINAGGWVRDDESGRYWLALTHWLVTETKGLNKGLDKAAASLLKDRDAGAAKRAAKKAGGPAAWEAKSSKVKRVDKGHTAGPSAGNLICARDDCTTVFHIKQGHKGRRPKYCVEHRSR